MGSRTSGSRVVAVVTGANKGIGLCIVRNLCQRLPGSADLVYLTSRNTAKGLSATETLLQEGLLKVRYHQLDIESEESVKRFANYLRKTHDGGLQILVNNASISYFTDPAAPMTLQASHTLKVNYFGTLTACRHLFPLLSSHARVVNVSSALGHLTKISAKTAAAATLRGEFSDPNLTETELTDLVNRYISSVETGVHREEGWPNSAYVVSKLAVSALTRIQQRRIDETRPNEDILINSVHPGWVRSDMTGGKGVYSTEEGSQAPTWTALLPHDIPENPRGAFVWRDTSLVDWVKGPVPSEQI